MNIKLGDSSIDVVANLAKQHTNVQSFCLTAYSPSLSLQERLAEKGGKDTTQVFKTAATYRESVGPLLPYWESILIASWGSQVYDEFFKESVRHSGGRGERKIVVSREELTTEKIKSVSSLSSEAFALSSVCKISDGSEKYIPLMDFRVSPSKENLVKVMALVKAIGVSGAILKSGKSYHFFGFELLSKDENISFLGKCVLLAPITDARYIGHRLIDGSSDLRITTSEAKSFLPIVEGIC